MTVHRWTELKRKELPTLINNPFSFINDHILASDVGPRFVNPIFYSFHNFALFAGMKRRFQVLSPRKGFVLRTSFHTNTTVKREQDLYFASSKQSFLNLQFVIRQQDQEFDKQCILPAN